MLAKVALVGQLQAGLITSSFLGKVGALYMATKTSHFMRPLVALVALVALMTVMHARPAQAATLSVNTLADEQNTNGLCSLREAIINADKNNQSGSTDCAAGSARRNDTITFTVSGQITLNSSLPYITDPAGLTISNPIGSVTDTVTIIGTNNVGMFTINSVCPPCTAEAGKLTLDNLIVTDSGTIFNLGHLTVTNSLVSGNNSGGAAILNTSDVAHNVIGHLTVTDSTFSRNSDFFHLGGGAIVNDGGTATVTGSTFTGNSTNDSGGAIFSTGNASSLTVNNSTFSGNTAPAGRGGGIYCDAGSFSGTHDTFTNNTGGNLVLNDCSVGLSNTILANAKRGSNCSEPITDGGYNLSDDASCAFDAATSKDSTNPRLDPKGLQDNGGPTKTIALLTNSPAIDAIPKATNGCGTDVNTDQRGILRPQDGDANGTAACDIGAFEVRNEAPEDKQACKKGGYEQFGFKNQGQCIKAVNTKNAKN
jgi:CSLREA domain-containing protein